jgi:predicted DsbA family dithiol-disulfide isomerase
VTVDVVSDVVCPWCFIGKKRIEKAIALKPDIPVTLRFHPYFLNDWIPREGISREQYLITKFGSVERYAQIAERVKARSARRPGLCARQDQPPAEHDRLPSSDPVGIEIRQ